jgi:hypothetical protein
VIGLLAATEIRANELDYGVRITAAPRDQRRMFASSNSTPRIGVFTFSTGSMTVKPRWK